MSKLLDYMNQLDQSADARDAHAADPVGSMTNFGLSQDEQDALNSGDHQQIAAACGVSVQEVRTLYIPLEPYN